MQSLGTDSLINLPSFSGATLLAIILANALLLFTFFILAGPTVIAGRDLLGRPLPGLGIWRRVALALILLAVTAFLAGQAVLFMRFWPYFIDQGAVVSEQVTSRAAVPSDDPVVFWIATTEHRFGVTKDIYERVGLGDLVEIRYRAADDTLYELRVVRLADHSVVPATPTPAVSGSPSSLSSPATSP